MLLRKGQITAFRSDPTVVIFLVLFIISSSHLHLLLLPPFADSFSDLLPPPAPRPSPSPFSTAFPKPPLCFLPPSHQAVYGCGLRVNHRCRLCYCALSRLRSPRHYRLFSAALHRFLVGVPSFFNKDGIGLVVVIDFLSLSSRRQEESRAVRYRSLRRSTTSRLRKGGVGLSGVAGDAAGRLIPDRCDPTINLPCFEMSNNPEPSKDSASDSTNELSSTVKSGGYWNDFLASFMHQASIYGVAAGYCISASLLSIINKWAVMKFPYPGALTAFQYFTSVLGVLFCGWLKLVEHDRLTLKTMWKFLPAAIIFYLSLFTNSELLLHANVDTFIVFRSAVPLFVAVGETIYLNQPWPSIQTWLSLATIFGGSIIYVLTDYQFTVTAYMWALAYLVSMSIDFVYIKHVVMTIGLNTWGLVLYNNLEALMLFPLELLIMGELKKIKHDISDEYHWYSFSVILPVALSCLFGLAISFFGFSCRRAISATGFTVLGIVNKLLTVVINLVIWDKHSTLIGTIGLLICMFGGVLYQQSAAKPKTTTETKAPSSEEEQQQLLEMQTTIEVDSTSKIIVSENKE